MCDRYYLYSHRHSPFRYGLSHILSLFLFFFCLFNRVFFLQLNVVGSTMGTRDELEAMLALLAATGVRPTIDATYDLRDARAAFERLNSGDVVGKLVLTNN